MVPFSSAVLVTALLATSTLAQSEERVWSSVAWILYGDRTPLLSDNPTLTPLGAQQLKAQGAALRTRYLWKSRPDDDDIDNNGLEDIAPIQGIERYAIDNRQLKVMSTTDTYNVASAMALFQGLYPPATQQFSNSTGGITAATLANGTIVNYPLDGYQYPHIQTVSRLFNPTSIYLDGTSHCNSFLQAMTGFTKEQTPASNLSSSSSFYASLYSRIFNSSSLPLSQLDFRQAYHIYDYANYHHLHNPKLSPLFAPGELPRLRELASSEIRSRHGNLTIPIRSIAGRTLASHTKSLLVDNIRSAGYTNKLNLMFSSFEPFASFFALAKLDAGASRELFRELPYPGGMMLFELFSTVNVSTGRDGREEYPEVKDLKVRFLYKNSSAPEARVRVYSLFETGVNYPVLDFLEFEKKMGEVGKEGDQDVEFGGKGQRKERVGSWELRNGKQLSGVREGVAEETGARVEGVSPPDKSHLRAMGGRWGRDDDDDDRLSLYGREPVKAREF
ncbi:histidine phosphatase superfamily [Cercophora samala]|uniref:Histidine phosphatase superfamily n=1 Tax=Cercophora samala TaxID=330535 RepID=A0AA40D2W9_9PEZI|nr:histidine phosphatase superfamily [Cercophora samala]